MAGRSCACVAVWLQHGRFMSCGLLNGLKSSAATQGIHTVADSLTDMPPVCAHHVQRTWRSRSRSSSCPVVA